MTVENHGKIMENLRVYRKLWKNHRESKSLWKIMENPRVYGKSWKIMENPRVYGKSWKNHGKSKSLWKNHGKSKTKSLSKIMEKS